MRNPEAAPMAPAGLAPHAPSIARGAAFALAVLFSMNLLNYVDRYVFAAVGESIIRDLKLNDVQFGILAGSFMFVYTVLSPLIGWMGDRYSRRKLLAFGVGLWSVATVGTTFSRNFGQMCLWRALLGVGEASYGIVAPTLLADFFPPKHRGRAIGCFYLALPLGGALGYVVGATVSGSGWGGQLAMGLTGMGSGQGWRSAFLLVGLPGLFAASAGLMIRDPGRGFSEGKAPANGAGRPSLADYASLFRTRSYMYNIFGMAAVTFTTGAFANWAPAFYQRVRGMPEHRTGLIIGALTAVAGLLGIAIGMWLPDLLLKRTSRAYLLWAGLVTLLAVPFGLGGIIDPESRTALAMLFAAMVLMASTLGPCNTVPANVVPANQRAAGYALNIFLIHLLGDISSPVLIGWVSDRLGRAGVAESALGRFLAGIGAVPVQTPTGARNLTAGMLLVIPMLAVGALFFLLGSRHLGPDAERARKLGGGDTGGPIALH